MPLRRSYQAEKRPREWTVPSKPTRANIKVFREVCHGVKLFNFIGHSHVSCYFEVSL
jgi:hypothetical protein